MSESRRNGRISGQALEEQAPERVHVGALVDGIALDLFGRDVVDRPDELARLGEPARRQALFVRPKSDTYAWSSGVSRTFAGFTSRWTSPRAWAASRALATWSTILARVDRADLVSDRLLEVGPLDVAHRDVQDAVGLVGVVDRNDVRMVDRRGELGFTQEPIVKPLAPGELGRRPSTPPCA